jgi:hypothetical protein
MDFCLGGEHLTAIWPGTAPNNQNPQNIPFEAVKLYCTAFLYRNPGVEDARAA